MTIHIKMTEHEHYIEFIVTGQYDIAEGIEKFSYALEACRKSGLTKMLVDYRELEYRGEATEKVLYAFGIEDLYRKHLEKGGPKLKIAYLAPLIHHFEPGRDIAHQIPELKFDLFEDREQALGWLDV